MATNAKAAKPKVRSPPMMAKGDAAQTPLALQACVGLCMPATPVLLRIGGAHTSRRGAKQRGGGDHVHPRAQAVKNALPPPDMMVDLASRFVLNAPAEELRSFERMLFLIEQVRALTFPTTLSMVQP